jgi:hypothetical protein
MIVDAVERTDDWFRDRVFDVCVIGSGRSSVFAISDYANPATQSCSLPLAMPTSSAHDRPRAESA